jgi:thioredoxin 1
MAKFDSPITTNDQSLDRVLANPLPVLLFLSPTIPDETIQSTLADIARNEAGKLLVAKVNSRENPETAKRFRADGSATLAVWQSGTEKAHLEWPTPEQIREAAAFVLGRGPAPHQLEQKQEARQAASQEVRQGAGQGTGGYAGSATGTGTGAGTAIDHPITVSERDFEQQVLRSPQPVLVDFWAPWCGPCRMIAPTLEKLAREYAGKIRVAKLNVDENQRIAGQFNVMSIPLLILFKNGKPVQQLLGAHPEQNIRRLIEQAL